MHMKASCIIVIRDRDLCFIDRKKKKNIYMKKVV